MPWLQNYDPFHNAALSTVAAGVPVVVMLILLAWGHLAVHRAAAIALLLSLSGSVFVFGMPAKAAGMAAVNGALFGLMPIGWMVVNIVFLHRLTVERGWFEVLKGQLARLAPDPRIQVVLVAFCFGAFFEGTAGFGAPVAVTSAMMISLGFKPLQACGLSLIANTAPVAFGSLGTPLLALTGVTGLDLMSLSKMVGRQLPLFSLIIPFWVVVAHSGWRGLRGVWPAPLTAGLAFAIPQFFMSNFHGPTLVDIVSSICSMAALVLLLRFWKPKDVPAPVAEVPAERHPDRLRCWVPWLIMCALVFAWGLPKNKESLDRLFMWNVEIPGLHHAVQRAEPVAPPSAKPEEAVFKLNMLSTTGTGIWLAAMLSGLFMGFNPVDLLKHYAHTVWKLRLSLLTIATMLALGYVTKYSGTDATLGLALAHTGWMYPFFSPLLGWLGVALTGSDTASNVLFGSLQTITAHQVGVSPVLLASANS
ncbi:MAG: glycolate permease GlcA, partial [Verrucomicrobiaceae bacterium]|nr:glycolate permease GlcA [Verrucomicrobiaceae bacterium]